MKKYLTEVGYSFTECNDLKDKQFALVSVSYSKSDSTHQGNYILDRVESYALHLTNFDSETFGNKMELAIQSAIGDGIGVFGENNFNVENVENGYAVSLEFTIIKES